ncbi:MAG TPA: RNA polymerase sigma-70 factor [Blastocatellia bacterium]|nr:RNA polymerase sigma-70 factor [Blastocatellia bacterium]
MTPGYAEDRSAVFEQFRHRLFAVAYRMMGTRADAEEIVQEAYLRWHRADTRDIRSAEAWLVTVVTRLSIDRLRKAAVEREAYTGPWLPEPLFGHPAPSPEEELELAEALSMAFMVLLERLAPVERAAFLLHDIFDCAYPEIARILAKSEAACRQIVHRARERVHHGSSRFQVDGDDHRRLIERFVEATNAGDEATLLSLFAEDATLTSDGGGVVFAARKVVHGRALIARLFLTVKRRRGERFTQLILPINGEPGLVSFMDGVPFSATSFETDGRRILALYNVLNPEKLKGIDRLEDKAG